MEDAETMFAPIGPEDTAEAPFPTITAPVVSEDKIGAVENVFVVEKVFVPLRVGICATANPESTAVLFPFAAIKFPEVKFVFEVIMFAATGPVVIAEAPLETRTFPAVKDENIGAVEKVFVFVKVFAPD